jgi:histone acetyltransferase (RNA polymerase elongator complex component)
VDPEDLLPEPSAVGEAIDRVRARQIAQGEEPSPVEIGLYGGDVWNLPRGPRTALLDAAECEVRRGRACGIRITASPMSVLRAPMTEFRARGIRAVEVPIHSLDRRVLRTLGVRHGPRAGLEAVGRLNRFRMRSIVTITPGLPGSCHRSGLETVEGIVRARPVAARVLPALVLEGTLLHDLWLRTGWQPMSVNEAVASCRHIVDRLRARRVEVIRVGLQPAADLLEGPEVLAGPFDVDLRLRVEAELMRASATVALARVFRFGQGAYTLVVHPREESWLRGPMGESLEALREQFRLVRLLVIPREDQPRGEIRVLEGALSPGEVPPPLRKWRRKAS